MDECEQVFECQRCGGCCSNLVAEDRGVTRGLTLLPEETEHFPEAMVRPAIGIGRRPHDKGFRIIAYQLTVDICPHLTEDSCDIYERRPASCRQFPFSLKQGPMGKRMIGFDLNCPSVSTLLESRQRQALRFEERPSAEKLLKLELEALKNPRRAWFYDLGTSKWVRFSDLEDS